MTRKLFSLSLFFAVVFSLALLATAQEKKVTLTGHIVDKACSGRFAKKDNPQEAAGTHTKNCSLMENCTKSGFGIYADGKYTEFDDKGNALAKAALEKSSKDKGATFKVSGKMMDGKLAVSSIDEMQ